MDWTGRAVCSPVCIGVYLLTASPNISVYPERSETLVGADLKENSTLEV